MIGDTVSRYRVQERLGGGGAGVVYRAVDLKLGRTVALKFLSSYRSGNEADKRRFLREARASSALDHPNICTVYEIDETEDERLFIAMSFCEGETLKQRVERGPLPLLEAVHLAAQIAAGLGAAHAKGIVHRDVKPANVMVSPDGRVKIVDFGIAKLADQSRLTRDGTAVGTAGYMSPEQIRGEPIDARVDVWSLGVVLYEMISGRLAFSGNTEQERVRRILSYEPEPIPLVRAGVPHELERIVGRALAKNPAERYARMEEMRAGLLAVAGILGAPLSSTDALDPTLRDLPSASSAGSRSDGDTASLAGRRIGHYRVLEHVSGGGMGVVYQAEDLRLSRIVALKFLPPELTRDPEAKARFLQEARAASVLDHPNICTIHEVGETEGGRLYLAMPYYDGETLRKKIERGPLPIEETTDIAQQIARGLAKAHRGGIVHRDIKPANLMVTGDGVVKILDFGLAKLVGAAAITRTGSSVGTPAYMSPEQARGEEVDHRTDLWSLGVVLYEMLAGRRPFRGEHEQAVLYSLLNEQPKPLSQLRPDVPPELERIVEGLLAKDPAKRYPTVEGPLGDLKALRNETMTTTVRTPAGGPAPAGIRPWVWAAGFGLVAALAVAALYVSSDSGGDRKGQTGGGSAPPEATFARLTDQEGSESFPSLSPDGRFLLFVKSVSGNADVYLQRIGGGNPVNLTLGLAGGRHPAGLLAGRQADRLPLGARRRRPLRHGRHGRAPCAASPTSASTRPGRPTGATLAFATESVAGPLERRLDSQLWVVEVATREQRLLGKDDAVQPSWSPNGKRIAYWGLPHDSAERILWTIPAAGGEPVKVLGDERLNWNPVWSPDGRHLYFVSDRSGSMNVWRVAIDEASGRTSGEPEPVTSSSLSLGLLSLSRDGRRIVYATDEGKANVERRDLDPATLEVSAEASPVTQGSRAVRNLAVSPDGGWIAFVTASPQEDLFVVRPDGSGLRPLTERCRQGPPSPLVAATARASFSTPTAAAATAPGRSGRTAAACSRFRTAAASLSMSRWFRRTDGGWWRPSVFRARP